jgi:hypothetical protein
MTDSQQGFRFWSTANARAGRLRRPDRPRETERSLAPDRRQELLPSAVIASHARKSLLVIEFRPVRRQLVSAFSSCVNSAPQRKIVSPQWDSCVRPAKRQHQRCIGCEKRPCFLPLSTWLAFAASSILSSGHPFARLKSQLLPYERRTNTGRLAKVRRFVCDTCANPLQQNQRKFARRSCRRRAIVTQPRCKPV